MNVFPWPDLNNKLIDSICSVLDPDILNVISLGKFILIFVFYFLEKV